MRLCYEPALAIRDLCQSDAHLKKIIEQVGTFSLELFPYQNAFEALTRSIIYQQLAGRAAQAIHERLLGMFAHSSHPLPEQILALSDEQIRTIGLSRAKTIAIRDLSMCARDAHIPSNAQLAEMDDQEIIDSL